MKLFFAILMLCSTKLFAQQSPANFCKYDTNCHKAIVNIFTNYSFSYDTSYSQVHAYIYNNAAGDELQFFYGGGNKPYFKSIVANTSAMYKLYSQYYGREITIDDFKKGETWRTSSATFNLTKRDGWEDYWMLRIFK